MFGRYREVDEHLLVGTFAIECPFGQMLLECGTGMVGVGMEEQKRFGKRTIP